VAIFSWLSLMLVKALLIRTSDRRTIPAKVKRTIGYKIKSRGAMPPNVQDFGGGNV
jgi:hypothetical protein